MNRSAETMTFNGVAIGSELEACYKSLELDASEIRSSGTPRALLNLSSVLERAIQKNEKLLMSTKKTGSSAARRQNLVNKAGISQHGQTCPDPVTIFHGLRAPNLSIRQYMERIFKYSRCSPCCFVIAQIYMDRFFQRKGGFLTSFNVHRLLITSVMVAAKFVDDECYSNAYYAKVGGVSTEEMNNMELEFLFNVEFRLFVTTEEFERYCEQLDNAVVEENKSHQPSSRRRSEKWASRNESIIKLTCAGCSCKPI